MLSFATFFGLALILLGLVYFLSCVGMGLWVGFQKGQDPAPYIATMIFMGPIALAFILADDRARHDALTSSQGMMIEAAVGIALLVSLYLAVRVFRDVFLVRRSSLRQEALDQPLE